MSCLFVNSSLIETSRPTWQTKLIHDMEGIGYTSAEGANQMVQLFAADFLVDGSAVL